ncbi:hypothetical protein PoB_006624100 [Plakobranchus ocellatus]|uniref:Uncharacterized protein n=1 Tax=Plakobranchus ocellatus TaxID=259542 RepID=A0AAV4D718_9GAST|nr:hypothetical protein PoB_006624100 [Plakobranchus ocellatus]
MASDPSLRLAGVYSVEGWRWSPPLTPRPNAGSKSLISSSVCGNGERTILLRPLSHTLYDYGHVDDCGECTSLSKFKKQKNEEWNGK